MFYASLFLALTALPALPVQDPAPEPAGATEASAPAEEPEFVPLAPDAAGRAYETTGPSTVITFADLDPVLLDRHATRPEGQDVLTRLLNGAILRSLAVEAGVEITPAVVDARIAELDQKLLEQGLEGGLARQLVENDVDPDIFRDSMVLSLMQEELVRISLGLPVGERPGVGPQNAWMDEILGSRETELFIDPLPTEPDAPIARSNEVAITLREFQEHLRDELPRPFVEQAITQLVLQKRLFEQAGAIDAEQWHAAIEAELDRRRARHNQNPETQGVGYEQLLEAQGLSLEMLRRDPAVIVTALTSVLAWRQCEAAAAENGIENMGDLTAYRDAGRRLLYQAEQELFDGYFGEKLFLTSCVLRAQEVPDEVVTRSTAEGLRYLGDIAKGVPDKEGFTLIVSKISEDANAAQTKGALGWFGREGSGLPEPIIDLVFDYWEANGKPGVAGPIEFPGGVALFWVGPYEPAPAWSVMSEAVQSELQARILNGALPGAGIHIFRDPPPAEAPSAPDAANGDE